MSEDPKEVQGADEGWIEDLVGRLNEALIAGGRIIAAKFVAMERAKAKDRMDKAKAALLADVENIWRRIKLRRSMHRSAPST